MHTRTTLAVSFAIPFLLTALTASALSGDNAACPSRAEIRAKEAACADRGLGADTVRDEHQCPNIRCTKPKSHCPSEADLQKQRTLCENQGTTAVEYFDGICTVVSCGDVETRATKTMCEKIVTREGCVKITCSDSYVFDSCKQAACEPEERTLCRTAIDRDGCTVKTCGTNVERTCPLDTPAPPKPHANCEIVRLEETSGCHIQKCSDGTYIRGCPVKEKAGEFRAVKPSRRQMHRERKENPMTNRGTRPTTQQ